MKRLLCLLVVLLTVLPSCSMRTYLSTDLLPETVNEVTGKPVLLSASVMEIGSGKSVTLEGGELAGLLLNLENMECTRGKTDNGETALYRVSFTLSEGAAADWLIYNKVAFSVGEYRYSSLRGSIDLFFFDQLFD